ncbi:MAG TPA: hypothetical protein VFT04_00515, partial [Gemmatimonadales bacterium]|nr:hypothetical protein [Gemmatimonadales bacterium]
SLEVAQWRGQRALKASAQSEFVIPLPGPLPQTFTVEVGVVNRNTKQVGAETIVIYGGRNPNSGAGSTRAEYGPIMWGLSGGGVTAGAQFGSDDADVCIGQETTVRLSMDGEKLKLYADERRLASVPNAKFLRAPGLVIALAGRDDMDNAVYVTRIRVAGGAGAPSVASTPSLPPTTAASPTPTTAGMPTVATVEPATVEPAATPTGATTVSQATLGGNTPTAIEEADRKGMETTPPLAAPTDLRAKYVRSGRMAFVWNTAAGATPGVTAYELWLKSTECPTYCRVNMAGMTDTIQIPENTFDYTGQVSVHVRAVEEGRDPSPNSVPIALPPVPRYKGVYRITATGIRVDHETTDNPLEIDGKRDEVLVRAKGEVFLGGQSVPGSGFFVESKVHGDRNAVAWSNATSPTVRIKAGTASLLGGLKTGDEHRSPAGTPPNTISFPLIIWEGSLRDVGERVVIVPTVWEVDRAPDWTLLALPEPERDLIEALGRYAAATVSPTLEKTYVGTGFDAVRTYYRGALDNLPDWALEAAMRAGALPPVPMVPGQIRADSVDDALLAAAARIRAELADMGGTEAAEATTWANSTLDRLLNLYATWAPRLAALLNNEDRPIGIYAQDGQQRLDAQLIHLGFREAEHLANSAVEIPVRYVDKIGGGDYTLFLRVERLD